MQRLALLIVSVAVLLCACGPEGTPSVTSMNAIEWVAGAAPTGPVRVRAVLMGGPALEQGPGVALTGADAYACAGQLDSNPPRCSPPTIPLVDVPANVEDLPMSYDGEGVWVTELVDLTGTSDGTTIVVDTVTSAQ